MIWSGFAFTLNILHLAAVLTAWLLQSQELFAYSFYYPSPVLAFFNFLDRAVGVDYGGKLSMYFIPALLYNLFKYFCFIRGVTTEQLNFFMVSAIVIEITYLVASGIYLFHFNYY